MDRDTLRIAGLAWLRRLAGLAWLSGWILVVRCVHEPWNDLGGLVSETVRYWERVVLGAAAIAGGYVGAEVRDAVGPGKGRSHAGLLRWILLAPAAAVASSMVVLRAWAPDWIGVALNGLLAYWAGLDITLAAWPLLAGRTYSFRGAIDDDDDDDDPAEEEVTDAGWG